MQKVQHLELLKGIIAWIVLRIQSMPWSECGWGWGVHEEEGRVWLLDNFWSNFLFTIGQDMKASLAAAGHSLFPTTYMIYTVRWLTVDTISTTSPAQSWQQC